MSTVTQDLQADPKLRASPRQRKLLEALSTTEWRRAPPGTLGPTLVALWNRGLITGRMVTMSAGRYSDAYEWRRMVNIECPLCGRSVTLNANGTMWKHYIPERPVECLGSEKEPDQACAEAAAYHGDIDGDLEGYDGA